MKNYLELVKTIMSKGHMVQNRTANRAQSLFGAQLRWNLAEGFPLLTTRKLAFRWIVEELLFFLRGDTDTKILEERGVTIWMENTRREFLDNLDLDYPEGEMGPGYGFQWRNWGGEYRMAGYGPMNAPALTPVLEKRDNGIDQIARVIHTLKTNPYDRRMIVSAWNVEQLDDMALPPCHLLMQFDASDGRLSLQWYQRSVDVPLGLPFNIASYALLTHIIAEIVGLPVGDLIFTGGNVHVYENQMADMEELLKLEPKKPPTITIPQLKSLEDAEALKAPQIVLAGYEPHPKRSIPFST